MRTPKSAEHRNEIHVEVIISEQYDVSVLRNVEVEMSRMDEHMTTTKLLVSI